MTCEFCGKSRMDVRLYESPRLKYCACVPCARDVDSQIDFFTENLIKSILEMMKFPGGVAK